MLILFYLRWRVNRENLEVDIFQSKGVGAKKQFCYFSVFFLMVNFLQLENFCITLLSIYKSTFVEILKKGLTLKIFSTQITSKKFGEKPQKFLIPYLITA